MPIDIVHHVDTPLDGTAPGVLYGYGAYEASMPPWFSVARLSLLDRGFVWALVHPRGGGELGRQWYLDGKLLSQAQHVHRHDRRAPSISSPPGRRRRDRLCIRGGSAGGLLVGACITMRPDLFAAAVAEVPFVDVVTTMSDPTLPLTVTEWEEWGDPRDGAASPAYMRAYSPYDNTRRGRVPGDLHHRRAERPAGQRARAGQVDGPPALGATPGRTDPAAHRDGRRPRRPDRPLRRAGATKPGPSRFILATT